MSISYIAVFALVLSLVANIGLISLQRGTRAVGDKYLKDLQEQLQATWAEGDRASRLEAENARLK